MAGKAVIFVLLSALLPVLLSAQNNTIFIFNNFNASIASTDLTFQGAASIRSKYNALCLTNQSQHSYGHALYSHPVSFKDTGSTNTTLSFSTTFVFTIVSPTQRTSSGRGLAFIIAPNKSPVGTSTARILGLFNISVGFDTVENVEYQEMEDNHIGIDLNQLTSTEFRPAGYWNDNKFIELDLNSGQNFQAWIDYDHLDSEINVTVVQAGLVRPFTPLISLRNNSLSNFFQEETYVGFSVGTVTPPQDHCILAWSFTTNGAAPALDLSHLPSLLPKRSKSFKRKVLFGVIAACILISLLRCLIVYMWWWKRSIYRDFVEEWEVEYWPHRFKYKDLHVATKGFGGEQVIGCGGFGKVYKGVLPSNGLQVAVKCILRESTEGIKEFIAEISSLGRLQHRNLVQIRGYCRQGVRLFIVYDFMPNGSLDKLIFGDPKRVLEWDQRYKILRDVAAGLLYLHHGWDQRVVHRDIKSSNILLDNEFNAKLGDFGLARLYEHDEKPHTTCVMGTLGYIAPEVVRTGKATPSSDVYSFGIVMLEVACGRRPVELNVDPAHSVLLDWVRELHTNDRVMDAADPKLDGVFAEHEMNRVLMLGMLCCSAKGEERVDMRQVVHILEGQDSSGNLFPFEISTDQENTWSDISSKLRSTSIGVATSSTSLEAR